MSSKQYARGLNQQSTDTHTHSRAQRRNTFNQIATITQTHTNIVRFVHSKTVCLLLLTLAATIRIRVEAHTHADMSSSINFRKQQIAPTESKRRENDSLFSPSMKLIVWKFQHDTTSNHLIVAKN